MTRTVAILLFSEIDVLDFAGPFEVFGVTGRPTGQTRFVEPPFRVIMVAERGPVYARKGLCITPTYLLDGLAATTHCMAVEGMRQAAPQTELRPTERWVDNGKVITSVGISASIDASLYVVGKLHGVEEAAETARYMQYDYWQ